MFHTPEEAKTYTLAGKAKITLTSKKTQKWYTFRVERAEDRATGKPQDRWFVQLLAGPDNVSDFVYLGMIFPDSGFRTTKGSKLPPDSVPVRAFNYFWRNLLDGRIPDDLEIRHEGVCGRCGRPLTVPESIDRGIGPDCWEMMGL